MGSLQYVPALVGTYGGAGLILQYILKLWSPTRHTRHLTNRHNNNKECVYVVSVLSPKRFWRFTKHRHYNIYVYVQQAG